MKGKEGLDERLAALRKKNLHACEVRAEMLERYGYPKDYTAVKYECPDCMDTGYRGLVMCDCMRRRLIEAGYESSGIGSLIQTQSFETFSLDYYRKTSEQYRMMTLVYDTALRYANNFKADKAGNLLFIGTTGTGKTHLSTSIAKVVVERGYDVVYDMMQNILSDFEKERFGRSAYNSYTDTVSLTDKYYECDLLIMDDLGSELTNQFVTACLYNIINTRLNHRRATIINTNLTIDELRKRYTDRIYSRMMGEYQVLNFCGSDIRIEKCVPNPVNGKKV